MRFTRLSRSIIALAVAATAAVAVVGFDARGADAQVPYASTNGPYSATAGVACPFTGTSNIGPLAAAVWSFSDGSSIAGTTVYKAFAVPGVYTATFSVTTVYGQVFSSSTTVSVGGAYYQQSLQSVYMPGVIYPTTPVYWPGTSCIYGTVVINGVIYCR